jgi:hypothetical protein
MSRILDSNIIGALKAGAAFALTDNFIFQSYFDSTLLETAIVPNNSQGNGIASSTFRDRPVAGVGIALLPMSQTPIAVLPVSLTGDAASQAAVVLKPGEVYYPGSTFRSLKYGVPYGWLGGGTVYMVILRENIGDVSATGSPEMIVHRQRMIVRDGTYNPASLPKNWPARFPWINATNNLAQAQQGAPFLAPQFTRVALRLRVTNLAAQGVVRLFVAGTEDFDEQNTAQDAVSAYDAPTTSGMFYDNFFPVISPSGAQVGGLDLSEFPVTVIGKDFIPPGGDAATAVMLDMTGNTAGNPIDVIRYGTLG